MNSYINASGEGTVHNTRTEKVQQGARIPNVVKRTADHTGIKKNNVVDIIKKQNSRIYI